MFVKIHVLDTKHIPQYVRKFPYIRSIIKTNLLKEPGTVHSRLNLGCRYRDFPHKFRDTQQLVSN